MILMKKLTIIIPIFNEDRTISEVIKNVFNQPLENWGKEIIIVDDGSTDKTNQILNLLKTEFNFTLLTHSKNLGKGETVKTAIDKASGDYILIQDADLEYSPSDWPVLLEKINESANIVVFGSRELNARRRGYARCVLGVRILTALVNILYKTCLTDIYTCYKLIPTQILKSLDIKSHGFEIEAEITGKLLNKKLTIKEVPINYYPRTFKEGKKIRFYDGLVGIFVILKNRLI